MPIELAGIHLERIHKIATCEQAAFVSHQVPGLAGNIVQNLGRDSVRLHIEGIFYGATAQVDLETLRAAYKTRAPVEFLAEIVGQAYFGQVIIERFEVVQRAGEPEQFSYLLTLAEYVEPPQPEGLAEIAIVDTAILNDAQKFIDTVSQVTAIQKMLQNIPDFGDPTPPLRQALADVKTATTGLDGILSSISSILGEHNSTRNVTPTTLLQVIPDAQQFLTILHSIIGSEDTGAGMVGILKQLQELDAPDRMTALISQLEIAFSENSGIDPKRFTDELQITFDQAKNAFPTELGIYITPLQDQFNDLKNLAVGELSDKLWETLGGLQKIQTLIPSETRSLLSGASEGLLALKDQLISGAWGELRAWSESVQALHTEMAPLFTPGAGMVEEQLIAFLKERFADLGRLILPEQQSLAEIICTQLDQALSDSRVRAIEAIKTNLITNLKACSDFGSHSPSLAAAEASMQQLTEELADILRKLRDALNRDIATASEMEKALHQQYDTFAAIEIIDLGNIKAKFDHAIQSAGDVLQNVKLDEVKTTIADVLQKINQTLEQVALQTLPESLRTLQENIETGLNGLDTTLFESLASLRNLFTQIKEALRSACAALESITQTIEKFLNALKTILDGELRKSLEDFKVTVKKALEPIQTTLANLPIETVKTDLVTTLQDVCKNLKTLPAALEESRQQLEKMFTDLQAITFVPVVDAVIAEFETMRAELNGIDPSALNAFCLAALTVAVQVLKDLAFEEIRNTLLDEMDAILQIPEEGVKTIQTNVAQALATFNSLEPARILQPLQEVFTPMTEQLDALQVAALCKPLDDWYVRLQQAIQTVSPAALLQPVVEGYAQLQFAFAALAPDVLVQPLQETIDSIQSELQQLNVTTLAAELSQTLDRVRNALAQFSPEQILAPLVKTFDKIFAALDRFQPGILLTPVITIFDQLAAPLAKLEDDDVQAIKEAAAPLRALSKAFDPQQNFRRTYEKYAETRKLLAQIKIGQIIADLKGPYDALQKAFKDAGVSDPTVANRIAALNPLHNVTLAAAAAEWPRFQTACQNAFPQPEPPQDLVTRYQALKLKLEMLIPAWIKDDMTPDSIQAAFKQANPMNFKADVQQKYADFKANVKHLDPRLVQVQLKQTYENVQRILAALDPEASLNDIQAAINKINSKLAEATQLIVQDLEPLAAEVETSIHNLDPQPMIQQLEALANEVKAGVARLQPAEMLTDLENLVQTAKVQIAAFDPASFTAPLQDVFSEIKTILNEIDVGVILQPLNARLETLRAELETGLQRAKTACDAMITAIPV